MRELPSARRASLEPFEKEKQRIEKIYVVATTSPELAVILFALFIPARVIIAFLTFAFNFFWVGIGRHVQAEYRMCLAVPNGNREERNSNVAKLNRPWGGRARLLLVRFKT
jgi:hypothetical protein